MTVAELIKKLLDECEGDTTKKVDFYVCASTDTCRQIADNDECIEVLQEIRQEIESNMESIIGKYNSSTPERDRPSAKIARNEGRQECLDIIDNHISAWSGKEEGCV